MGEQVLCSMHNCELRNIGFCASEVGVDGADYA